MTRPIFRFFPITPWCWFQTAGGENRRMPRNWPNKNHVHSGNLTWQWKIHHLKMYFLFKMGIFHCYVCLPEGKKNWFKGRVFARLKSLTIRLAPLGVILWALGSFFPSMTPVWWKPTGLARPCFGLKIITSFVEQFPNSWKWQQSTRSWSNIGISTAVSTQITFTNQFEQLPITCPLFPSEKNHGWPLRISPSIALPP